MQRAGFMTHPTEPVIRFHALIDGMRTPMRADRAALGSLPTRAYRYCEAATSASGYGWLIFPPIDLYLCWDGADVWWRCEGMGDFQKLMRAAQFPDFEEKFDMHAPPHIRGFSPPFLTVLPERGLLQLWTGLIARTARDWHILLRSPANVPPIGGITPYEGIIETDHWYGPLFTNLQFTSSDTIIRLPSDYPLLLAQPVPRVAYADDTLRSVESTASLAELSPNDWECYHRDIVKPNIDRDRPFGAYAMAVRKRRRCPAILS